MKYVVMCEGTNEKTILNLLLEKNKLIFSKEDLINCEIFHARQFVPYIISNILEYNKKDITVIRVGDKQNDKLLIPTSLKHLISEKDIIKCRTRPELEILLIINENMYKKYNNSKHKGKPKIFAKENIKFNNKKYDGSSKFWNDYYSKDISKLINNIKECKKLTKNNKKEIYLADLLK